jgi:hypothetical protein
MVMLVWPVLALRVFSIKADGMRANHTLSDERLSDPSPAADGLGE